MNRTSIEWTNYTWNPVTGCKHGCPYCYARRLAEGRLRGRFGYGNVFEPTLHEGRLLEPLKVQKSARIFVCSMGDLMGEWVPTKWICRVIDTIWDAPQHVFQLLTKNPARYAEFKWPPNVWFGTSIDGTGDSMERLAVMRDVELNWGDAIRYVSFEPLLAEITKDPRFDLKGIDWVILGAMTGPQAQPPALWWVANLSTKVRRAGAGLFVKNNCPWLLNRPQEFPSATHEQAVTKYH